MTIEWRKWKWRRSAPELPDQLLRPLKRNVWFSFGVALTTLGLIGVTAYVVVVKLRENDALVTHTHQVISSLHKIQSLVADAETRQGGYLITGEKVYLKPYDEAQSELQGELSTLRQLIADNPAQNDSRRELEQLVATRLAQLRDVRVLREGKGVSAAGLRILADGGIQTDLRIREVVGELEGREDKLLAEREQRALRTSLYSRSVLVLGSLVAFGFVGVAFFDCAGYWGKPTSGGGTTKGEGAPRGPDRETHRRPGSVQRANTAEPRTVCSDLGKYRGRCDHHRRQVPGCVSKCRGGAPDGLEMPGSAGATTGSGVPDHE